MGLGIRADAGVAFDCGVASKESESPVESTDEQACSKIRKAPADKPSMAAVLRNSRLSLLNAIIYPLEAFLGWFSRLWPTASHHDTFKQNTAYRAPSALLSA